MPYLPYFSNCREWDSYVVFHNLVESDRCQLHPETTREGAFSDPTAPKLTPLRRYAYPPLPHYDDIQAVKFLDIALGFDKVPLAVLTRRPFRRGGHDLNFGPMASSRPAQDIDAVVSFPRRTGASGA